MTAPGAADLERFREVIQRHLGLRFGDGSADTRLLRQVLAERVSARRCTYAEYLLLAQASPGDELTAWASSLTVNETYFLRHVEQFNALAAVVPAVRHAQGADPARLRLLSAGCATGEEPYSMAIALRQADPRSEPSILGVDVDRGVLETARRGRYTDWSLRALPDATRARWFTPAGGDVLVDPAIRGLVRFEQHNIVADDRDLWRPESYDVVFCRNVLMYLAPDAMAAVVARIGASLVPGGFLFLGSAETLRGISAGFELRESHGAFYYQRTGGPADAATRPPADRPLPDIAAAQVVPGTRAGVPSAAELHPGAVAPTGPGVGPELDAALDLLRQERFSQALDAVDTLLAGDPGGATGDPERLLLRATLLTQMGDLGPARQACEQLIGIGGPATVSAGAHLLLAQGSESGNDVDGAVSHGRAAAGLDPQFAMPHVQLGRLARRVGRLQSARRHYQDSLRLLPGETGHRVLLFGGGFDREALISVCRTQLGQLEQLIPPGRPDGQ